MGFIESFVIAHLPQVLEFCIIENKGKCLKCWSTDCECHSSSKSSDDDFDSEFFSDSEIF